MTLNCSNCRVTGLAITLARYSVVPAFVKAPFPDGITGARVKDVALDPAQFGYALRTLRAGYLYLFYEDGARGKAQWETYTVNADGSMLLQPSTVAMVQPAKTVVCSRDGHTAVRTMYLCIENPAECGNVWFGFSERTWSSATLTKYGKDSALRSARMQLLNPKSWIEKPANPHACEATPKSLHAVLEYMPPPSNMDFVLRPGIQQISEFDGSHRPDQLNRCSTIFPVYGRHGGTPAATEAHAIVKSMQRSSPRGDGKSYKPVLLALWDPVGITRELNGHRNEAAGRLEQYETERKEQVVTMHQLDGIRKHLENAAEAEVQGRKELNQDATRAQQAGAGAYAPLRVKAQAKPAVQRNHMLQDISLLESWEKQGVPTYMATPVRNNLRTYDLAGWQDPKAAVELNKAVLDNRKQASAQADNWIRTHEQAYASRVQSARAKEWPKYASRLNTKALDDFRGKHKAFVDALDKLVEQRTAQLIKWLEAKLFLDTMADFDQASIGDGIEFNDMVSDVVYGIGLSRSGAIKLDAWAKDRKNIASSNLLWRAMVLNQAGGIEELNSMLSYADRHQAEILTEKTAIAMSDNLRNFAKLADIYKKSQTFADTAAKAADKGFKKFTLLKADKLVLSAGQAIYAAFRVNKALDTVGEKIVQHLFCLRSFVDKEDSLALLRAQGQYQNIANTQMMARLSQARTMLDLNSKEMASAQRDALKRAWSGLAPDKSANAIRDIRLALVVAIFEGANFAKCAYQLSSGSKRDARTAAYMVASGLAVTSLMFDVAATAAKNVYSASAAAELAGMGPEAAKVAKDFGERTRVYEKLKMAGGALSAVASGIGVVLDVHDARVAQDQGQTELATLYRLRGALGVGSLVSGLVTTVTYAPELTGRIVGKMVGSEAAKAAARKIAAMVLLRLVAIGLNWIFTVGGVAVTVYMMYFKDSPLQVWCTRSRFGLNKPEPAFRDFDEQQAALEQILGIPEEESKVAKA